MKNQAVSGSQDTQHTTTCILQRLTVVLAVTAASYGLVLSPVQASFGSSQLTQPCPSKQPAL